MDKEIVKNDMVHAEIVKIINLFAKKAEDENPDPIMRIKSQQNVSNFSSYFSYSLQPFGYFEKIAIVTSTDFGAELKHSQMKQTFPFLNVGFSNIQKSNLHSKNQIIFISIQKLYENVINSENPWIYNLYIFENHQNMTMKRLIVYKNLEDIYNSEQDFPYTVLIGNDKLDFPLKEYYEGEDLILNLKNYDVSVTFSKILEENKVYDKISTALLQIDPKLKGNVVVYLPGDKEIDKVKKKIIRKLDFNNNYLISVSNKTSIFNLNSDLKKKIRKRKIFLISSDVEEDVYVDNVGLVIDSFFHHIQGRTISDNINVYNDYMFIEDLGEIDLKEAMKKRKSLLSIKFKGKYKVFYTKSEDKKSTVSQKRKLELMPLYQYILDLSSNSELKSKITEYLTVYNVYNHTNKEIIKRDQKKCQELEFVNKEFKITPEGKIARKLPLNLENSSTLIRWMNTFDSQNINTLPLFPCIMAVSILEKFNRFFVLPYRESKETSEEYKNRVGEHKEKYYEKYRGENDLETGMNIILTIFKESNCFRKEPEELSEWIIENKLNLDQINETIKLINILTGILSDFNVRISKFDVTKSINILRTIFKETYKNNILTFDSKEKYYVNNLGKKYRLNYSDRYSYLSPAYSGKSTKIISLISESSNLKEGEQINYVYIGLDIKAEPKKKVDKKKKISGKTKGKEEFKSRAQKWKEYLIEINKKYNQKLDDMKLSKENREIYENNPHIRQVFINSYLSKSGKNQWTLKRLGRSLRSPEDTVIDLNDKNQIQLKYKEVGPNEVRTVAYRGQRKLFNVIFNMLVNHGHLSNMLVYAGASPGVYFNYLAELFPKHHFYLYDPRPLAIKNLRENVTFFQQLFEESDAYNWTGQDVIFMSDIRRKLEEKEKNIETKKERNIIIEDMQMQREWVEIMNPIISSLKFRLPWTKGSTRYLKGDIEPQPWTSKASPETRLIVKQSDIVEKINYNHIAYENAMYYHNTVRRTTYYEHDIDFEESGGLDHCFDCSYEIRNIQIYLQDNDIPEDEINSETAKMSKKITEVLGTNSLKLNLE